MWTSPERIRPGVTRLGRPGPLAATRIVAAPTGRPAPAQPGMLQVETLAAAMARVQAAPEPAAVLAGAPAVISNSLKVALREPRATLSFSLHRHLTYIEQLGFPCAIDRRRRR